MILWLRVFHIFGGSNFLFRKFLMKDAYIMVDYFHFLHDQERKYFNEICKSLASNFVGNYVRKNAISSSI